MSPETPIKTVGDLIEWLSLFDASMELKITYDSGFGTGASLSQEGIYEKDGKVHIDVIS